MISVKDRVFRLDTVDTTYLFRVTKFGHLEHIYYGPRLVPGEDAQVLAQNIVPMGNSVVYDEADEIYSWTRCTSNELTTGAATTARVRPN